MAVPFDACSFIAIMGLVLCLQPKGGVVHAHSLKKITVYDVYSEVFDSVLAAVPL